MTQEQIYAELTTIFQTIFDDEDITLCESTSSSDIEDWDSLEQINLVMAIEKRFEIKFNIKEVNQLRNVGEMVHLISEKIAQK